MSNRKLLIMTTLLLSFFLAAPAFAAPQMLIETRIEQRQVIKVDGKEQVQFVSTETTAPGNILKITVAYQNSGDEAAKDVVLNNPIPEGTAYLNGSATNREDVQTEFSIDGGKSYKKPAMLTYEIVLPGGKSEIRVASPEQYTHIRWRLASVPARTGGEFSFEVLVK